MVRRCLSEYDSLTEIPVHDVTPSPNPLKYRTTAKLIVSGTFRTPKIGIYRRHSHEVIDIEGCPLHHTLINNIIAAVKDGITRGKIQVYSPSTGSGLLRYLVIRVSDDGEQAMVTFVTAFRSFNEIHHLAKHLQKAVPKVAVIVQNENSSSGNAILGDKFHFLTKQQALVSQIGSVRLTVSPRSFLQVNSGSAKIIYDQVARWGELTGKEKVIDLYCGIGGITLFLASGAEVVVGIEAVEAAVVDAEKNARMNGIGNCSFAAGDAGELLAEIREEWETADLIVLNPPRRGCDRKVLNEASKLKPAKIIYVSCSPWTLARDLDILSSLGYKTREVQPVDMFPQTSHIENVAILTRD
jgi:23S rRNA (uracil1939-C5)-methyltransferase